jgi:CHASE3 domain sensor protein
MRFERRRRRQSFFAAKRHSQASAEPVHQGWLNTQEPLILLDEIEKFDRAASDLRRRHIELATHVRDDPPTLSRGDMEKVLTIGNELVELSRIPGQLLRCIQEAMATMQIAREHLRGFDDRETDEVSRLLEAENQAMRDLIAVIG